MNKKEKPKVYTTPKGIASYPYLTRPDTKFDKEGVYTVKLRLSAEDAQDLKELVDKAMDEALATAIAENPDLNKKQKKKADAPYSEVLDDDKNETGEIDFSFKQKAKIKNKKGEVIEMTVPLFDAKGRKVQLKGYVGGGSVIKIAFQVIPFFTKMIGAGVSLRLKGVQILDLVTNEQTAESLGFGEEEGFEGTPMTEMADNDGTSEDTSDPDF